MLLCFEFVFGLMDFGDGGRFVIVISIMTFYNWAKRFSNGLKVHTIVVSFMNCVKTLLISIMHSL